MERREDPNRGCPEKKTSRDERRQEHWWEEQEEERRSLSRADLVGGLLDLLLDLIDAIT